MTSKEIREKFLEFMEGKGHTIIPSASLIPDETDPTVLFTTAGMHPLVPYLMGEKHPGGNRVANVQKCVRTGDIDEVGDISHLTFFEMMGNWSFGDYFKKEAIEWSWEFLTDKKWLGLDKNLLAVSVFSGDENAPFDEEAFDIWKKLGVPEKRIAKLPKENNWWGPAGKTGPCGPDSEMFYWVGDPDKVPESFDDDNDLWIEIWNDVFMQYNKTNDGNYEPLAQKNVDTGLGLARAAMIMQSKDNIYETDLFAPIMEKISELANSDDIKSKRIIADHIKASVFMISDGVEPLNTGRGYVLRRLIRRAVRYGKLLGINKKIESIPSSIEGEEGKDSRRQHFNFFVSVIAELVIEIYKDIYPELEQNKEKIFEELRKEEEKFGKTLEKGLKEFEKGTDAFILFSTYGFPFELTKELAKEKGIEINEKEFDKEFKKHQELSKTASAGMFKGGLADSGEKTAKLHTATHLLHQALREVLGENVAQKGSNITAERLRFDFSHPEKMTDEQKRKVEDIVNEKIKENLPVICEEMTVEDAKTKGAIGIFDTKYGDKVKVYSIGDSAKGETLFSREICGGPHAKSTGELDHFRIKKEEASSAGVRRIKAVLE